jgi:hypothetical protein
MSKVIGFANKYYTLWDHTTEDLYTSVNNQHYKYGQKDIYGYIKNISMTLDKVKELYPNIEICEDLRGMSRDFYNTKIEYPAEYLNRGLYCGYTIADFENLDQLIYFHTNFYYSNDEIGTSRKLNVEKRILELGGILHNDIYYTPKSYDEFLIEEKRSVDAIRNNNKRINFINSFKDGGVIEVKPIKNLHISSEFECATLTAEYELDGDIIYLFINFPADKYKEYYYNGFSYGLPTIKGVGKKIKNKTVTLNVQADISKNQFEDDGEEKILNVLELISIK